MAELTNRERLLPYLLDRLTNDHPEAREESLSARTWTLRQAHQAVVRDLGWLLNTPCRTATDHLDEFPEVSRSVLNYGMPPLAGLTSSTSNAQQLEKSLLQAIQRFEPRVLRQNLKVRSVPVAEKTQPNSVALEIEGLIWGTPMPDSLYLKTELDLESGECRLQDKHYG